MCKNPKIVYSQFLPCGKCEECLKRKRIIEYNRLKFAFSRYGRAFHITLTYDNEHVVSAKFDDVRRFIEKIRRKKHFQCEYYCVKEYGERHGRIHFHLILFVHTSIPNSEIINLTDYWTNGFTKIRCCDRPNGFRYLTDYLFKDYGGVDSSKRNFTCSKDLGYKEFFNQYEPFCVSSTYTGSWSYLPRCWRDKYIKYMLDHQKDYFYYSAVMARLLRKGGVNKVIPVSILRNGHYVESSSELESKLITVSREILIRLKEYYRCNKESFCRACLIVKYIIPYFGRAVTSQLLSFIDRTFVDIGDELNIDLIFQVIDHKVPCSEFFDSCSDLIKCVFQDWEFETYGNCMIDGFQLLI